jgi:hypothetical protein
MDAPRAFRRLVQDVCANNAAAPPGPDLRLFPTLPPMSATTTARDHDDLDAIDAMFGTFREEHRSTMHAARPSRPVHNKGMPQKRPAAAAAAAAAVAAAAAEEDEGGYRGLSFARCLLMLSDPAAPLLSPRDVDRCLVAFVERAAAHLTREADVAARAYADSGMGPTELTHKRVAESLLLDATACLSDAGLNDAAILHMARTLRTALVVRRGGPGSPCIVFPPRLPQPPRPTDAAALLEWADGAFALVEGVDLLRDAQRILLSERDGQLATALRDLQPFAKQKMQPLIDAAAKAAVCRKSLGARVTKAQLVDALEEALSGV